MEDSGRLDTHLQNESSYALPEFQRFPKIPRLYRDIIITEKIDGTNAQILITEDGRVFAGSRKRWLTREKDNYGFRAWVVEHHEELLQLGPGRHFGEWWGKGIQRGYGLDHRRFSLFNVNRWFRNILLAPSEYISPPKCCDVVPLLYVGPFVTYQIGDTLDMLYLSGSSAAPGFKKPEGIVIFHQQSEHLFKVTIENDEAPKGKKL